MAARGDFNFQNVDLFSFDCETTSQSSSITGAQWNRDEAILRVFKAGEELEYMITKSFAGKSLFMMGEPVDGSKGSIQFNLKKSKKSSVTLDSKGSTKLNCDIELL